MLTARRRAIATRVRFLVFTAAASFLAACASGDPTNPDDDGETPNSGAPVAAVVITPPSSVVGLGSSRSLSAIALDSTGVTLTGRTITWTSSSVTVVSVNATTGAVTGVAKGSATITATSEGKTATTTVFVMPPVSTVTVTATSASMIAHSVQALAISLKDASGTELSGRAVAWSSSNTAAATVDANGLVTSIAPGSATITATSEGKTGTVTLTVTADAIGVGSIVAGVWHSCGLTATGRAYCWGVGTYLGVSPAPITRSPVEVAGGRTYAALAAGGEHTIGLTTSGEVYAWGQANSGQLGNGTVGTSHAPVRVSIPATVKAIASSGGHLMALTTTGAVYSWGVQVTAGAPATRSTPYLITGLPSTIEKIAAADYASFAITNTGVAYGWGEDIGDGIGGRRLTPVLLAGNLTFAHIASGGGGGSKFGITTAGVLYSWGSGLAGSLGQGSLSGTSVSPAPVAGGRTYTHVVASGAGGIALTASGDAYAWGWNSVGQIGDGTTTDRSVPTLVIGGKKFASIAGGHQHVIGMTTDGQVFGFGRSDGNQTGAGSVGNLSQPTAQVAPSYDLTPRYVGLSIAQGGSKSASIVVTPTDGGFSRAGVLKFSGMASFAVTQGAPGVSVTASPTSMALGAPTTLNVTVTVATSAPLGVASVRITGSPSTPEIPKVIDLDVTVTQPPPPAAAGNFTCTSEASVVADGYQCVTYNGKTTLVKYKVPELWGTWVDRSAGVCFNWKEDGQANVRYQGGGLLGGAARTTALGRWGAMATTTGGFYPNPTQWYIYTAQADDQTKLLGYDSSSKQVVGWSFTKEGSCPW